MVQCARHLLCVFVFRMPVYQPPAAPAEALRIITILAARARAHATTAVCTERGELAATPMCPPGMSCTASERVRPNVSYSFGCHGVSLSRVGRVFPQPCFQLTAISSRGK